jgi:putative phage-type endonuclease
MDKIDKMDKMDKRVDYLINELIKRSPGRYRCDWHGREYILTLDDVFKFLHDNMGSEVTEAEFYRYMSRRIIRKYYSPIQVHQKRISSSKNHEQRTPEWFEFRRGMITGSEAGYMLGVCGQSSALNAFRGKIDLPHSTPPSGASAIIHGTNYECVAKSIYELRYGVDILEVGCLGAAPATFVGASPDGIVHRTSTELTPATRASWLRYGRLIEIKCPYSRYIDSSIKAEYEIQMMQQQYTCKLPICDFVECAIVDRDNAHIGGNVHYMSYNTLDDLLLDVFIPDAPHYDDLGNEEPPFTVQNANIPQCNLGREGYEKGILIVKSLSGTYKKQQILYPMDIPYVKSEIELWIAQQCATGNCLVKLWKVWQYDIKTVIYHQTQYETVLIPRLFKIWSNITIFRNMSESDKLLHFEYVKANIEEPYKRHLLLPCDNALTASHASAGDGAGAAMAAPVVDNAKAEDTEAAAAAAAAAVAAAAAAAAAKITVKKSGKGRATSYEIASNLRDVEKLLHQ